MSTRCSSCAGVLGGQRKIGVLLSTISGILGEYARTAPIEAFIASSSEHHPTDLAGLQGARLVTSVETEEGRRRWAESKLEELDGAATVSQRDLCVRTFFEFTPQFKLLVAGNHKAGIAHRGWKPCAVGLT